MSGNVIIQSTSSLDSLMKIIDETGVSVGNVFEFTLNKEKNVLYLRTDAIPDITDETIRKTFNLTHSK
jgi:hypothetical protein